MCGSEKGRLKCFLAFGQFTEVEEESADSASARTSLRRRLEPLRRLEIKEFPRSRTSDCAGWRNLGRWAGESGADGRELKARRVGRKVFLATSFLSGYLNAQGGGLSISEWRNGARTGFPHNLVTLGERRLPAAQSRLDLYALPRAQAAAGRRRGPAMVMRSRRGHALIGAAAQ